MLKVLLIILAVCLFLLILMLIIGRIECGRMRVTEYTVCGEKLPEAFDGYRFFMLADLHNSSFGQDNRKLLSAIDALPIEDVLIAGDMTTCDKREGKENGRAVRFLNELVKKHRVLYGLGNHEMRMQQENMGPENSYREYKKQLSDRITILDNRTVELARGEACIKITGLNLDSNYYTRFHKNPLSAREISALTGNPDPDTYHILIAHNPDYFEAYADWGADLVLSGHVHGGIVRLPLIGGLISPRFLPFPKYDYGRYKKGKTTMILTNGLGTHLIRLRFLNVPELCVITLLKK